MTRESPRYMLCLPSRPDIFLPFEITYRHQPKSLSVIINYFLLVTRIDSTVLGT
jgi:hypothetical protein